MMSSDIAPRHHGSPPESFTRFHVEGEPHAHAITDGARLREYLVHLGLLGAAEP